MRSIYEQALGEDFKKLHPNMQQRFGMNSTSGIAQVGTGTMDRIWVGHRVFRPFLALGTKRHTLFPDTGREVPFMIENYAYLDGFGRETVTWVRTFDFGRKQRRFDATMIYSQQRGGIVDYLGTHQHLAVDIELSVNEKGGLHLVSTRQRWYEKWIGLSVPLLLSGTAEFQEWYDEETAHFRIKVKVSHPVFGPIFGYEGRFKLETKTLKGNEVPIHVKPVREERRE
ncbi:DUF4166 domain-containing protein [Marinicrinis sediminis]|uniref:DUF4166 domain-containing protein n=1 Tax=Marinicrinis sediminis TaxID=1652465 RepID=A0ABW5RC37_9BACL